jgi:hypothetical protein
MMRKLRAGKGVPLGAPAPGSEYGDFALPGSVTRLASRPDGHADISATRVSEASTAAAPSPPGKGVALAKPGRNPGRGLPLFGEPHGLPDHLVGVAPFVVVPAKDLD